MGDTCREMFPGGNVCGRNRPCHVHEYPDEREDYLRAQTEPGRSGEKMGGVRGVRSSHRPSETEAAVSEKWYASGRGIYSRTGGFQIACMPITVNWYEDTELIVRLLNAGEESESLRAQLAQVTKERDEAVAEVERISIVQNRP